MFSAAEAQVMTLFLIDGYNVLHALFRAEGVPQPEDGMGWEQARERLVDRLASFMAGTADRAIAVFDSKRSRLERSENASQNVEVYFGSFVHSADAVIERVAYRVREDETVVVVSSDLEVQQTVFSPTQGRFPVVRRSADQFVREIWEGARSIAEHAQRSAPLAHRVEDRLSENELRLLRRLREQLEREARSKGSAE